MSALTGTLITAIYLSLLFPEFLALTLFGDILLFLCLRLVNTLLQWLCRYLRQCVESDPRKRMVFTYLLLRLLYLDAAAYLLSLLLLLLFCERLNPLLLIPFSMTLLSGGQIWHEREILV
jgi:hypothetical protein